jgi:tripeptide aminopeptidase
MEKILDRFLRYVAVDTKADPESESQPSAARELDLLKMLCDELNAMGVEATLDEYGYVMGSIPSNCGKDVTAERMYLQSDSLHMPTQHRTHRATM